MVKVGMGEEHPIYPFKLAVGGSVPELPPETGHPQVFPVKSGQRRQQPHRHWVKQPGPAARSQILLIEPLVPLIRKAEIQKQPPLPVLEEYLGATNLVDTAVKAQAYHRLPRNVFGATQQSKGYSQSSAAADKWQARRSSTCVPTGRGEFE